MPYYKALVPTGDWKQTRRHIGCFYVQAKNMIEAIDNIKKNPSVFHNQMLPVNRLQVISEEEFVLNALVNPVSKKYVDEATPREYEDIRDYVYKSLINERTNNLSLERSEIGEELIELVESCKNAENNQEKKKRIMMLRGWANKEIKNHEEILEEEQGLCSK